MTKSQLCRVYKAANRIAEGYKNDQRFAENTYSCCAIGPVGDDLRIAYGMFFGRSSFMTWFNDDDHLNMTSAEIRRCRVLMLLLFAYTKGEL